jgi:hypothetical protein
MEVTMSLPFKPNNILQKEYGTKSDLHYGLRVPYSKIAKAIDEGKLELHLIDGKVQIRVEEAIKVFFPEVDYGPSRNKDQSTKLFA